MSSHLEGHDVIETEETDLLSTNACFVPLFIIDQTGAGFPSIVQFTVNVLFSFTTSGVKENAVTLAGSEKKISK